MTEPYDLAIPQPRVATASSSHRGSALITTMIVSAVLLGIGAFAVMQARLDLLIHHHTRAAVETFYVAEAGLEHALADLSSDPRFDRLLGGPDGIQGTADDGFYPFRGEPPDYFPRAPLRYEVRVERTDQDSVDIISQGTGGAAAARTVSAAVLRSTEPYLPAAASAFSLDLQMLLGDEFSLLGSEPEAAGEEVPALAVAGEDERDEVLSQLSSAARERIIGPRGAPSVAARAFVNLTELAARIEQLPEALLLPDGAAGELGSGILISRGSLRVGTASGNGLLLVQGDLLVDESLRFSGLVAVMGDVRFEPSSTVNIEGGFLQGAPGSQLNLLGAGRIQYDRGAIESVDAITPGLLPRSAVVAGWRERP